MVAFSAWERLALLKCMHKREHWTQWRWKSHVLTGFTQVYTDKHVNNRPWLNIWVRLPNHKARNVGQLQSAKQYIHFTLIKVKDKTMHVISKHFRSFSHA